MINKTIKINFKIGTFNDLNSEEKMLVEQAQTSINSAYAPYSGFLVGASVLLENGELICGSNQENVAFPSGLCAERVAIFSAGSSYPNQNIKTIAVSARSKSFDIDDFISPCGACRQAMSEYEEKQKKDIKIILHSPNDKILIADRVSDLLPFVFVSNDLKRF